MKERKCQGEAHDEITGIKLSFWAHDNGEFEISRVQGDGVVSVFYKSETEAIAELRKSELGMTLLERRARSILGAALRSRVAIK